MRRIILATLWLLGGCGSVDVANLNSSDFTNTTPTTSCTGVAASFVTDVVPIFTAKSCASTGCHGGGATSGGLSLEGANATVFAAVTANSRIDSASPANSKLLRKSLGLDSHGGGKLIDSTTAAEYTTIFCWIQSGAANN